MALHKIVTENGIVICGDAGIESFNKAVVEQIKATVWKLDTEKYKKWEIRGSLLNTLETSEFPELLITKEWVI